MRTRGRKYQAARQQVPARPHSIEEAVPLIQKVKYANFDETVELAMRLGVDPKLPEFLPLWAKANGADLVSEDGSPPPAGGSTEERLRVYSLVNTLVLNVAEAKSAVLLWNGAQPATLSGHLDLSRPLLPDPSVVAPSRPAPPPEGGAR